MLETHNLVNNDLPLIHKELERKAKAILDQRKTKKTPVDTLRRMLEGLHAHLKTTSISISKEAGTILQQLNWDRITYFEYRTCTKTENSNTRTKLRRVLTETKGKALETIELINSTDKTLQISYEDFNEGVFPWETVLDRDDTQFPTRKNQNIYTFVSKNFISSFLQFPLPKNIILLIVGCYWKEQGRKLHWVRKKWWVRMKMKLHAVNF